MTKCSPSCEPCCDFCIWCQHEIDENGEAHEPIGCNLHNDDEHDEIAMCDGYCDDYYCFLIEVKGKKYE